MGNKAKILSIKQNIIVIENKKKSRSNFIIPVCSFVIVAVLLCMSIESIGITQIASSMCYVYNPVNSLYNDNSSLVFANAGISKNNLDFTLPIVSNKYEILSNGDIVIDVVNSIMVKSLENGVIDYIGVTNDGVKYIRIMHTIDAYTLIENVDIVGVNLHEVVKKGQEIATAKPGSKITVKIFYAGNKITNIKISQSKIIWKA